MASIRTVLAAFAIAMFAGCIRIEQKLVINADASGQLEVHFIVPNETTQRMAAMRTLTEEMAVASEMPLTPSPADDFAQLLFDPTEAGWRKKIAAYADFGIRLTTLTVDNRNASKEVTLTVLFDSLERLRDADFFADYGFSLVPGQAGSILLQTRRATRQPAPSDWDGNDQEVFKMLAPLLNGFRCDVDIQTPGAILKTNADNHGRYSARWMFDFDADHNALVRLQRTPLAVLFDGKGLKLPEIRQPQAADEEFDNAFPDPELPPPVAPVNDAAAAG
jgi:hypothetical protein